MFSFNIINRGDDFILSYFALVVTSLLLQIRPECDLSYIAKQLILDSAPAMFYIDLIVA